MARQALGQWLLVLALALAGAGAAAHDPREAARDGVLDLTGPGGVATTHDLAGDWGFAWQRFVDPSLPPAPAPTVRVPGSWNAVTADGKPPGTDGFGSYTLLVKCPAGQQLALAVPAQRTAMRLFVNGRLAASQGVPSESPALAHPAIGQRATLTESFACPLRVTVHLSNYSHRAGGLVRAPVAGPLDLLASDFRKRLALDTILLGAYLVLSFLGILFYLARRKDLAPLMFGLFCLAQTIYVDMTGERLLLQLAGSETPWEVYLRIEYLSWFSSMALFLALVHYLFARLLGVVPRRLLAGAAVLGVLVVALTPARVYSHLVLYGQALGLAMGAYVTGSLLRATRSGRRDAGVMLAGMGFLAFVLAANLFEFHAGVPLGGITALGLLAFVLSPALVLLRRLARALTNEEQRHAEQREKVDLLVRTTQAGILDWDAVRNATRFSPRLLEMLGYPADADTGGWPIVFDRIHPQDRDAVREIFLTQLRDHSVKNGEFRHQPREYRLLRRDGGVIWVHAEAISVRDKEGRALRYICSFLDITEHRAVAEGLQRQNAALAENARLREDVERMSRHDLKTPLNSIIGVARLLREDPAVLPEHRDLLAITERAGYRLLEMVNLSLDLSRMELGTYEFRPQAVNLVDVVGRVMLDVHGLAEGARVHVRPQRAFSAPVYARAEELLCYSILANLVKNAIEATPPGGSVKIGLEPGDPVRLWVRNPGRVPPEVEGRFFDKYATAGKSGGTGLGTYSARMMARVQEGELKMQTGDEGTLLTLTLRALGAEQLPPPQPPGPRPAGGAAAAALAAASFPPRRVLLADDDEYNRLLLLRYLPSPPFTVESAENGAAVTEAVARQWPDIVLIDMEMPVMNGLEAVAWIRQREAAEGRPPCPIVMMSSNDDPVSIRRGLKTGASRYLTKPFTREALLAVLRELDAGSSLPTQVPLALDEPSSPDHAPPPEAVVWVDGELLQEVPAFLDSRRRMVEGMADALTAADREQLRAIAHRAAGGLALFGFRWAAWQSRRISARAAEGQPQKLQEEIERLREHLRTVRVRERQDDGGGR